MANIDPLTGIANRRKMHEMLKQVFGDDENSLLVPTVTSSGNTINVTNPGKGLTKQGTAQENGFTLN